MLKFIKDLFKPEEKAPFEIRFDGIPRWLESCRQAAIGQLGSDTEKERAAIRSSAGELGEVAGNLQAAQFNEAIHPRIRSIAQKSLPQYYRAVTAALEKPLPDEPEEFYAAAAELLKACVNSAQSQGKYLTVAFPEEMKSINACVAEIGRSINAMNGPVSLYRTAIDRISGADKLHDALVDLDEDLEKSREKEERILQRIRETDERIAAIKIAEKELERKRNEPDLTEQENALLKLRQEQEATLRQYSAVSMTASHVLRKAEKVARRQQKVSDERAISALTGILSDHAVPDPGVLAGVLDAAYIPARKLIDGGEVALKNREEQALFSSQKEFSDTILAISARYADQAARFGAAEKAFLSHPVITRHEEVAKELTRLTESLAKEKQSHADLVQWQHDLELKIPSLREKLQKNMEGVYGGDVQISYPDTAPVSP
jgi:iron-sulfur cluster repair protein YtfE (RIC family)